MAVFDTIMQLFSSVFTTVYADVQHYQRLCAATERGTQSFSTARTRTLAQSQATQRLPPAARVLHCTISGEGPGTH